MRFEPHEGRDFLAKLGESVKEIKHGGFELTFGAVKGDINNFLAQEFSEPLHWVQVGQIEGQKDLHEALASN